MLATLVLDILINFSLIAYVNHAWICSWNQPVLSNKGNVLDATYIDNTCRYLW